VAYFIVCQRTTSLNDDDDDGDVFAITGTVLRHNMIEEFNVDSKAEYSALSSTRSRKKCLYKRRN